MMRNIEVCDTFISGNDAYAGNLRAVHERGIFLLLSYDTAIAELCGNKLIVNDTKYSKTTSCHQTCLKRVLEHAYNFHSWHTIVHVQDVPTGTHNLHNFL